MICASIAPEHQGSDLLLRTNCVSWILIILFASPAWHGVVIYPAQEAAEGRGKKKIEIKIVQNLQQITSAKTRPSSHGYTLYKPNCSVGVFPWLHFCYRLRYGRNLISHNCGLFLHLRCVWFYDASLWLVNILSKVERTWNMLPLLPPQAASANILHIFRLAVCYTEQPGHKGKRWEKGLDWRRAKGERRNQRRAVMGKGRRWEWQYDGMLCVMAVILGPGGVCTHVSTVTRESCACVWPWVLEQGRSYMFKNIKLQFHLKIIKTNTETNCILCKLYNRFQLWTHKILDEVCNQNLGKSLQNTCRRT